MAIKTVAQYANEVKNMGFDGIKKDNELFNAVSKALEKAKNKDQFLYLNDKKRDPEYLYLKYIKDNDINVSGDLRNRAAEACTGPKADKKEATKVLKDIDVEVNGLFKLNLVQGIIKDPSFQAWVDLQNAPEIKKIADGNAKAAGKKLGISDTASLSKAIQAMMKGEKADALKALDALAKSEKLKEKAAELLKALEAAGLA